MGSLSELSIFDNVFAIVTLEVHSMPSSYVIGEHFEAFIKAQIQKGRYASASEVIRDGLRVLEEREEIRALKLRALRAEIQKGAQSGAGMPAEEVFERLERKYESMTRNRDTE